MTKSPTWNWLRSAQIEATYPYQDEAGTLLFEVLRYRTPDGGKTFKQRRPDAEWRAFVEQCKADFRFDPVKDGPLKAARLMAERSSRWSEVWERFAEAPTLSEDAG